MKPYLPCNRFNSTTSLLLKACLVGWGCRTYQLSLCRGVRPSPDECPRYDTKQSDGEIPVMLTLWGMRNTPWLPSLPGSLYPGMVAPDRVLSMGQIKLNHGIGCLMFLHVNCIPMLNWTGWNRTVLTFNYVNKISTYTKQNCLNKLNWVAWNRNVVDKLYSG